MNNITIEMCAEDRARLDRLAEGLDRLVEALDRKSCEKCVSTALEAMQAQHVPVINLDKVEEKLAETFAKKDTDGEAEKSPEKAGEAEAAQTDAETAEAATEAAGAPWDPIVSFAQHTEAEPVKPVITQEQLQQKITQLAAAKNGALKVKVREIVTAYAPKVSGLPEDKWPEIWKKLTALEAGE